MTPVSPAGDHHPPVERAGLAVLWLGVALLLLFAIARWVPRRRAAWRSWAGAAGAALLLLLAAGDGPPPDGPGAVAGGTPAGPGTVAPGAGLESTALPPPAPPTAPIAAGIDLGRPQPPPEDAGDTVGEGGPGAAAAEPGGTGAPDKAPASAPAGLDVPEPERRSAGGMELRIPRLWLSAPIVDLGRTAGGELEVPADGATVGWYEMTALPGDPGPALLGGHFDWEGSLAVFASLGELRAGDRVELVRGTGEDPLVYAVQSLASVDPDLTLGEILGGGGGSTLVLVTCGGAFDEIRGGYSSRLLVRATLLEEAAPPRGS